MSTPPARQEKGSGHRGSRRSRGGYSTSIHLRGNVPGLPVAVTLSGGQASDVEGYAPMMDQPGPPPRVLRADKGCFADLILPDLEVRGVAAVIPVWRNRKVQPVIEGKISSLRKPRRALLLKAQARRKPGHPIRQDRRERPRLLPRRIHQAVDKPHCLHDLDRGNPNKDQGYPSNPASSC
ncbi:MAG: transposase [Brevundimonas sp.]|uniref:transposase n=2 Tax=Brevundimonas sp. TaxID=1871086 RepID=UPI0039189DAA